MKKNYFLGIDVGTTAIKLGLIVNDQLEWEATRPLVTYQEGNSRHQLKSEFIAEIKAGVLAMPQILRQKVGTIGLSVAMHSLYPFEDATSDKIFLWPDFQAKETIKAFRKTELAQQFYLKTGTPVHPMTPFAKILYFKNNETYSEAVHWYGLKEILLELFTGSWRIDYSTATATGLLNLESLSWDAEILDYLAVYDSQLGELVDTTASFPITAKLAQELGLSEECQIFAGASDGTLATYAGFCASGIENSLTIGTSAALRKLRKSPRLDPLRQSFCYYLQQDLYVTGAPSNNGGNVLAWASRILYEEPAHFYQGLAQSLGSSPVGASGLRFAPYLNGERAPLWDMDTTASFQKMTSMHQKTDFVRAVIEGVLMNIRSLKESLGEIEDLTVNGGFFQTDELSQMTADVLGATCYLTEKNEPIFGLYYLFTQAEKTPELQDNYFEADKERHQLYEKLYLDYFD